jgi:hypothetical protein
VLQIRRRILVVALDPVAVDELAALVGHQWRCEVRLAALADSSPGSVSGIEMLNASPSGLASALIGVDLVLILCGSGEAVPAVGLLGKMCTEGGIMLTAIVRANGQTTESVATLRSYAHVLVVSNDRGDVPEILAAVGS